MPALIGIAAQIGDPRQSRKVMPWAMPNPRVSSEPSATAEEVAVAQAELEAGIVFS